VQDRERLLHGDDDQIVPIANSALLSAKIVKAAVLEGLQGRTAWRCLHDGLAFYSNPFQMKRFQRSLDTKMPNAPRTFLPNCQRAQDE
jgi:hypothetical protein